MSYSKPIKLTQDLGGTKELPMVVGVDGYTLTGHPTDGQVLMYSSSANGLVWGDAVSTPFAINSFSCSNYSVLEAGQSTTTAPTFAATYSATPTSAALYDSDNTSPVALTSPFASFSTTRGPFTKSADGLYVTFTLSATKSSTKLAYSTIYWGQNVYWGANTNLGPYNQSFITALSGSGLQVNSRVKTFTISSGTSGYIFYAFRSAYGTPNFAVGGFSAGARMAACATYGKNKPVAAVVALSGMLGMEDAKRVILPRGTYAPALIVVGENDLDYVKALGHEAHAYFDQCGVINELWEVPGGTHFYPSSSLVHKGGAPTVTSQLEPVMADFLYRALRLSELG
jgi:hypothetical protein